MPLNKTYLYIAIAVLLFLVGLGWYFYKRGKKQVTLQYLPGDLPGSTGGGGGASNDEIKNIANALQEEMRGINILGHSMEPYKRAILLSDTDIVKLYNAFNTLYQQSSGETLTEWLNNEAFSSTFEQPAYTLTNRLKKLNSL